MLADILQNKLTESGFAKISSSISEIGLYYRKFDDHIKVIQLIDVNGRFRMNKDDYVTLQQNAETVLAGIATAWELLNIVVTKRLDEARTFVSGENYWILDEAVGMLFIYEDQPLEFCGVRNVIEELLLNFKSLKRKNFVQGLPLCSIAVIAVNFIVFLILFIGDPSLDIMYMFNHGAMYTDAIIYFKEYYRLFTSMFMHFDIWHILNNMVVLYLIGLRLEKQVGILKYIFIYLISGLGGNLLSMYHDITASGQSVAVSAGASGAIFGIMGALLVVVIKHKGKLDELTSRRLFLLLACSLYYGFIGTEVDNYAHVGGAVTGIILTLVLYWPKRRSVENGKL